MNANRKKKIGKHIIEEFYWAGKMVVYVDHHLVNTENFDQICQRLESQED